MARAAWEPFLRSAARAPATGVSATGPGTPQPGSGRRRECAHTRRAGSAEARKSPARDLRLLPGAAAAWGAAALTIRLGASDALVAAILLGLCTAGCIAVVVRRPKSPSVLRILLLTLGASAMVTLSAAAHLEERASAPLSTAVADQAHITAQLRITGDPRQARAGGPDGSPRWLLDAELLVGTFSGSRFSARTPVVVLGSREWSSVAHGDVVRAAARPLATDPGSRAAALLIATTEPTPLHDASAHDSPVDRLRMRFLALSAASGAPDDGLMPGMVIGARSSVSQDLADTMKATGLTHLTAVSGANCSYVLAFVFLLCRGCRLPRWAAGAAGVAALAGFVLLVRPEPSVLRAAVMGAIGVLAVLTGRGRLSMTLLFLSIAVLLAADPWLSGDYAFILSVAATSGLVLAGPLIAARLGAVMPAWAAQLIAVPLAAQLFCSPVLALLQPSLPTYSLAANIAASPLVPFITIVGMVSVVLSAVIPWGAAPFAAGAGWAAAGVAQIARFFASAPLAAVPWPSGARGMLLSASGSAVVLAAVMWGPQLMGRMRRAPDAVRALTGDGSRGRADGNRRAGFLMRTAPWVAVGCIIGTAALWAGNGIRGNGGERWTVAACDVGQGDGLAVRTGPRSAMVFDAGPDPALMDRCLDRLGVDTVDVLVLTHLHEDHYGGVTGVFEGRSVHRLLYSTAGESLPRTVTEAAAAAGIAGELVSAGVAGRAGTADWSVLWPRAGTVANSENNASAVLLVSAAGPDGTSGVEILLTGDLEEDAADRFLADNAQLTVAGVDILKVAHHGARNGGSGMIEALAPRVAVISAGGGNDYGHPHAETLAALDTAGVHVARTDLRGTVLLTAEADALHIRSFR